MTLHHLQVNEMLRLEIDAKIKEALTKPDMELEVMVAKSDSHKAEDGLNRVDVMRLVSFFNRNGYKLVKSAYSLDIFISQTDLETDYRISINGQDAVADYFSGKKSLKALAEESGVLEVMTKTPSKKIPLISYASELISRRELVVDPTKDIKTFNTIISNADGPSSTKRLRVKYRKSYQGPGSDWRIDITQVKITEGHVRGAAFRKIDFDTIPVKTELEIELVTKEVDPVNLNELTARAHSDLATILFNTVRNIFRSPILVDPSEIFATTKAYVNLFYGVTSTPIKTRSDIRAETYFVNKKPKSLVYSNISAIPEDSLIPNIYAKGPYAATFKADGENCQLFIDSKGQINIIYATPGVLKMARLPGTSSVKNVVCSAELIDAKEGSTGAGLPKPQILLYEIYIEGGVPVHQLPLKERMAKYIDVCEGISDCTTHSISAKRHIFCDSDDPMRLNDAVAELLSLEKGLTYETDGIIFTKAVGTYVGPITSPSCEVSIYKWKPMHMNSVDAVIYFEPGWATINGPFKANLWVGYDSRNNVSDDVLTKFYLKGKSNSIEDKKLLASITCIREKMSGKVFVYEDAADSWVHDNLDRAPPKLALEDNTVVECMFEKVINLKNKHDYKFVVTPFRYRDDKTEMLHKNKHILGAANEFNRAVLPILESVKQPITIEHLTSAVRPPFDDSSEADEYYLGATEVLGRGSNTLTLLREFNNVAKAEVFTILYQLGKDTFGAKPNLLDMACGRGGDIHKYNKVGFKTVLGVDSAFSNIYGLKGEGAYGRFAKSTNGANHNSYLFLCMDCTKPWTLDGVDAFTRSSVMSLVSGEQLPNDRYNNLMVRNVLEPGFNLPTEWPGTLQTWNGILTGGQFNTASCMFAFHYFLTAEEPLRATVRNISTNLQKGGVFAAMFLDGRLVEQALEMSETPGRITDGSTSKPAWVLKKKGKWTLSSDPTKNYGKFIDVFIASISTTFMQEPVVDVDLVDLMFAEYGMERVTDVPLLDCTLFSGFIDTIASAQNSAQYDLMASQYPQLVKYIDLHRVVAYRKVA